MKKKIFYVIFFGIISIQILSIFGIVFIVDNQKFTKLKEQITLITPKDIEKILNDNMQILSPYRLSIINLKGEVLYDNKASIMDNHLGRQEVEILSKNLNNEKIVFTQRISKTLNIESLYASKLIKINSNKLILRVSQEKPSFFFVLLNLSTFIGIFLIISLIFSLILALMLSKKIIAPIEKINLSNPIKTNPYPELDIFMKRILKQKSKIKKQLKTIKVKNKEFDMIVDNISEGFLLINSNFDIISSNFIARKYLNLNNVLNLSTLTELKNFNEELLYLIKLCKDKGKFTHSFEFELNGRLLFVLSLPVYVKNNLKNILLILLDKGANDDEDYKRNFSANVTHELKTPLSVIMASSEMLLNNLIKKEDEKNFIQNIFTESKRLLTLIDNILLLSFFDENKIELKKTPVNLRQIVENVSTNIHSLALEKNIKLVLNLEEVDEIYGLSSLIEDMIYNLVENAIKYSFENNIVKITLKQSKNLIYLSVKDKGIGIALKEQENIFKRFYRGNNQNEGSGLGLCIVNHIAKLHKVRISLQSVLDKGTNISLIFNLKA
ncbi:HAMP domain-containing histidine kinase [Campylobacter sp. LR185c]|uniref:sensor histidine kinase n=1 Tax=Campylobacter sp. LR185c TaxID=2014525 RepID=UPI001237CB14|nr:HAMP domain-containing sensor histidine kinase [Campylobacter sp. LR185c]KAA6226113.1 HAMP domain-containing histidine kinase [Campylobacter sp. LR185c]KAA8604612.1 histidine kinase [Campylobacter sp. LR185c]